ncbi:hypothetical protein F2Q68_00021354 [Brassica cretica]|nr:hypothetical protein F2Q68_00021354 [Brassica cretica]
MVATLVLQRVENGNLHDPGGHLCNVAGQKIDGQGTAILEPSAATEDAKVPLQRTLADLIRPSQFYTSRSAIRALEIQGFQIHPTHFSHVGRHPYRGLPDKNPLDHIETLEDFVSGLQEDEATKDYIICKLFKCSLSGNVKKWLRCLPPGSLTTWNDVRTVFMTEFLDDARAEEMRDKIWTFSQGPTD